MMNVEEAFAILDKKTTHLHDELVEAKGRIKRLEDILSAAFPSINEPKTVAAPGYLNQAGSIGVRG